MRNASTNTATQTDKRPRAGYPFTGWRGDGHRGPAFPAQPQPGNTRSVLNENAGINGVRHLVHVFDIARVHCRRVVATAFQFHRMLAFHQTHQFIGYAINNNQYLFVGTNDVVIERSAFDDGLSSTGEVGGFIHHYRRVTGTCRNQAFIGVFARRFHYRFAAGHHQQADTRKLE